MSEKSLYGPSITYQKIILVAREIFNRTWIQTFQLHTPAPARAGLSALQQSSKQDKKSSDINNADKAAKPGCSILLISPSRKY
jgi:hypothetical protein